MKPNESEVEELVSVLEDLVSRATHSEEKMGIFKNSKALLTRYKQENP